MSKRALEAGLKRYPERIIGHTKTLLNPSELVDANVGKRIVFMEVYMQAEKDTIEMAIQWLITHADDYIVDMEVSRYKPSNLHVGGMCWEHLKQAMEEDNG